MHARPSRHIVALVSLLVFLLTGQAGVQGYVWCLGEDGHAALEYAADKACKPGAPGEGENASAPSLQEEHCGPCLDLPASFDATSRRVQNGWDSPARIGLPADFRPYAPPAFVRVLTAKLYPQPPPRVSPTLLAHRTVVLLN